VTHYGPLEEGRGLSADFADERRFQMQKRKQYF
jgi:hypothetical protein